MIMFKTFSKTLEFQIDDAPILKISKTIANAIQGNTYTYTKGMTAVIANSTASITDHKQPIKFNIVDADGCLVMFVYVHPREVNNMVEIVGVKDKDGIISLLSNELRYTMNLIVNEALNDVKFHVKTWIENIKHIDIEINMVQRLFE